MKNRRYEKQMQKLDLAQRAMALQQQFSPEQAAREQLMTEQARAAYYANEAFKREQPLRQGQLVASTNMLQHDAETYASRQALLASEQALRNASASEALSFQNSTSAERARQLLLHNDAQQFENNFAEDTQQLRVDVARAQKEAAQSGAITARNQANLGTRTFESDVSRAQSAEAYARAQAAGQQAEADLARRTLEARVTAGQEIAPMTREQLSGAKLQNELYGEQLRQNRALFPAKLAADDVAAMSAITNYAASAGPPREVKNAKGESVLVPGAVDPVAILQGPYFDDYRRRFTAMQTPPGDMVGSLPGDVRATITDLKLHPDNFLSAIARNRPYSTAPQPGTVNSAHEIARVLAVADTAPLAEWPVEVQALQMIRQNPRQFGMYQFEPSLIEPEDFALALELVGGRRSVPASP